MANDNDPTVTRPQPPLRFTLRELFVLTGLVCAFGASWWWAARHPDPGIVFVPLTFVAAVGYAVHLATRSLLSVIVALAVMLVYGCLFLPSLGHSPEEARRLACTNNLRNIALALRAYHDINGTFPPAYSGDEDGRPMHSWRVLLLPFLEQKSLYQRYDFSEPWDGPNNSKLHREVLRIYSCPSCTSPQPRTGTCYVAVVGPQTMWPGARAAKLDDLTDGTSNTLMVVEIANSGIHWMEPRDLDFSQMPMQVNPPNGQGISSDHPNVAMGAFADGRTQPMSSNTPPKIIRALLTAQGGETIGDY